VVYVNAKFLVVILFVAAAFAFVASNQSQPQSITGWFVSAVQKLAGEEQKIVYEFDEVEVLYAARFTVFEIPSTARTWADEISAPGEEITVTYGIVILKNRDDAAGVSQESVAPAVSQGDIPPLKNRDGATGVSQGSMKEEWIKVEGSRGSERMLSNSLLNEFDSTQENIVANKIQFSSHKKLVGSSIVKDFTKPPRSIYLFRQLSGGELVATHVCFKTDSSDFWQAAQSRDSCFVTKDVLKEIGASTETTGQVPVNAIAVKKPACPEDYACLTKDVGIVRACVVLASYACGGDANSCFKCPGSGAVQTTSTTPATAPTPSPAVQCIFTGEGCCNKDNLNVCAALPPSFTCGEGLVPYVKDCDAGCSAVPGCKPAPSPSPSPTVTPAPSPSSTPSPSPSPTPSPSPSPQPDSCSDSDNGIDYFTGGTASGFISQTSYSNADSCIDSLVLLENYCSGTQANSENKNCQDFNTNETSYACVSGTCKIS